MRKNVRCTAILMLLCLALGCFASCGKNKPVLEDRGIIHEPEFGGVYITATIEEFNALGFEYGDSVDVSFSNGYVMKDLPYYNGYYTATGDPLLIAYPGYDYVKAAINNGNDLWEVAGLDETCTARITLHKRGAFADIQNARDIHYEDDRALFDDDTVFANFRSVRVSGIGENVLYRSASPCDNQHNRASYVDRLIAEAGVNCVVDLADTDEKIRKYIEGEVFDSPYFLGLYEEGKVVPVALNMNYASDEFRSKVANALEGIIRLPGPYLVHCTEGKDRTGFICMLLEALAGASYDEIVEDYMITYDNYYGITKESDNARYTVIVESVLDPMIESILAEDEVLGHADLTVSAERYLAGLGMSAEQIAAVKARLEG